MKWWDHPTYWPWVYLQFFVLSFLAKNALWLQNNGRSTVTKTKEIWWYLNISCWKKVFLYVTVLFCIKVLSTVIAFAKECILTDASNSTWNGLYPQYLSCVYVLVTQFSICSHHRTLTLPLVHQAMTKLICLSLKICA